MPTPKKKAQPSPRSAAARPAVPAAPPKSSDAAAPSAGIGAVRVYLSSRELALLHQAASDKGQSPSAILRQAFRAYIGYED